VEQIELQLSEFTLRSRSVAVHHRATALGRGLDLGEMLVVRDPSSGHFFAGTVADIDFELTDTVYRVEIGLQIAPDEAAEWLTPADTDPGQMTTDELLALLGELKRSRRLLHALVEDVAH